MYHHLYQLVEWKWFHQGLFYHFQVPSTYYQTYTQKYFAIMTMISAGNCSRRPHSVVVSRWHPLDLTSAFLNFPAIFFSWFYSNQHYELDRPINFKLIQNPNTELRTIMNTAKISNFEPAKLGFNSTLYTLPNMCTIYFIIDWTVYISTISKLSHSPTYSLLKKKIYNR